MTHLRKEGFPQGIYNKLKSKKIGLCKVIRKFSTNAYEIELRVDISPVFSVAYLYKYYEDEPSREQDSLLYFPDALKWAHQSPEKRTKSVEQIIDSHIARKMH